MAPTTSENRFLSRDLSWLAFNACVLEEAASDAVPLNGRLKFLAIYSSNLDEFYRVRIPVLMALKKISKSDPIENGVVRKGEYKAVRKTIRKQQERFGEILSSQLIPLMRAKGVRLLYHEPLPKAVLPMVRDYFFSTLAGLLHIVQLSETPFFPENNKLYLAVVFEENRPGHLAIVNIPSDVVSRFFSVDSPDEHYVLFIDDIIKHHLSDVFPGKKIVGAYSFKVNRDADLDIQDEYDGDLADKIEAMVSRRDVGLATRLLYPPDFPLEHLVVLVRAFSLRKMNSVAGGHYHNLKDLADFPKCYDAWQNTADTPLASSLKLGTNTIFNRLIKGDVLVSTPYESYDTVLRFFNEAAIDWQTEAIYATLYRVAKESKIVQALINAAKNGKKVTVFVELKARFDESNNIRWAKLMKEAGVQLMYSMPGLKVHAKIALVKRKAGEASPYFGLLATGNFNETTAKTYTDHSLLTADKAITADMCSLFSFLAARTSEAGNPTIKFSQLLVARFNLLPAFIRLIDQEIENSRKGMDSSITLKMNNLTEETLISKLYEASEAGVQVNLIIRGICRLRPGIAGMSSRVSVIRIIGKYLEHGRIFLFHNGGKPVMYLGSADWMERNIYRRIEVCFPIRDAALQRILGEIIGIQLDDDANRQRIPSQACVYRYLEASATHEPPCRIPSNEP